MTTRVEDTMSLARYIAWRAVAQYPPSVFEDTLSDALWGLARADRSFESGNGTSFRYWATQRIWNEVKEGWRRRFGRFPGSGRRLELRQAYLDREFQSDLHPGLALTMKDFVADRSPDRIQQICDRAEIRDLLTSCLSERDAGFVWEHLALGETLAAIGERAGLTESRISQIIKEAKRKIRALAERRIAA